MAPGEFAKIKDAALDMVAATQAEAGCILYAYSQDITDPDLMWITEKWADQQSLNGHFSAPHMATFNQAMAAVQRLGADVRLYSAEEVRKLI